MPAMPRFIRLLSLLFLAACAPLPPQSVPLQAQSPAPLSLPLPAATGQPLLSPAPMQSPLSATLPGKAAKLDSGKAYRCGNRKTCRQIASCEEAYYLLHHCGLSRLDRDGDGIPCESLCQ
ncbi:excalibur calcium-binding domain-containing protein [uncultured Cardiobacterium sp.]|uniref:excalibur calcium-binding domain-containing protein n=1 Tax=uncultured Cardiobacterium sp. TaxID=417619 RepID=UPI002634E14D|nr:excalibur calcium-binding domain-containing protein [uncultured Cardiobacterium sp.]